MEFESYLNLLNMQHKSMTKEQIEAIVQQNRLHKIACEKNAGQRSVGNAVS